MRCSTGHQSRYSVVRVRRPAQSAAECNRTDDGGERAHRRRLVYIALPEDPWRTHGRWALQWDCAQRGAVPHRVFGNDGADLRSFHQCQHGGERIHFHNHERLGITCTKALIEHGAGRESFCWGETTKTICSLYRGSNHRSPTVRGR